MPASSVVNASKHNALILGIAYLRSSPLTDVSLPGHVPLNVPVDEQTVEVVAGALGCARAARRQWARQSARQQRRQRCDTQRVHLGGRLLEHLLEPGFVSR